MNRKYNLSYLLTLVVDALNEEAEFKVYLKSWKPGYIRNKSPEDAYWYAHKEGRNNAAWEALSAACKLLDVDQTTLVSTVKSMERWGRHHRRWDRVAHVTYRTEDSFREFIEDDFEKQYPYLYYQSTGRNMPKWRGE